MISMVFRTTGVYGIMNAWAGGLYEPSAFLWRLGHSARQRSPVGWAKAAWAPCHCGADRAEERAGRPRPREIHSSGWHAKENAAPTQLVDIARMAGPEPLERGPVALHGQRIIGIATREAVPGDRRLRCRCKTMDTGGISTSVDSAVPAWAIHGVVPTCW
jgi:hypothetical protein